MTMPSLCAHAVRAAARPSPGPHTTSAQVTVGIVHLGHRRIPSRASGGLHRRRARGGERRWGICGVSLRSAACAIGLAAAGRPVHGCSRRAAKAHGGASSAASAKRCSLGADRARARRAARRSAHRRSSRSTVTEKGYCHDPATGASNLEHPDIVHDLAHPGRAGSASSACWPPRLAARRAASAGAADGRLLRQPAAQRHGAATASCAAFARERDPALADWIDANAAFPSTMVDRIVPATTDADIAETTPRWACTTPRPWRAEPFGQWVIENALRRARGRHGRRRGAQFVADVAPFETMKLRLLNGSHSAFGVSRLPAGHDFVWQAAGDPTVVALVERQMAEEIAPRSRGRPAPISPRTARAGAALSQSGAAAPHAADRDGRIAEAAATPARDRARPYSRAGASHAHLALAVAGWMRYVERRRRAGPRDRRGRSARGHVRADRCATRRGDPGPASPRASCDLQRDLRRRTCVAHYAFREAVRHHVIALVRRRRASDARARILASHDG